MDAPPFTGSLLARQVLQTQAKPQPDTWWYSPLTNTGNVALQKPRLFLDLTRMEGRTTLQRAFKVDISAEGNLLKVHKLEN
jgi:hypothetical protein